MSEINKKKEFTMGSNKMIIEQAFSDRKQVYRVSSKQKEHGILVKCHYFEQKVKDEDGFNFKDYSFLVDIKIFGKNINRCKRAYKIFSSSNGKYNGYAIVTSNNEKPIQQNTEEYNQLNYLLGVIDSSFSPFTTSFICEAISVLNGQTLKTRPEFMDEVIKHYESKNNEVEKLRIL